MVLKLSKKKKDGRQLAVIDKAWMENLDGSNLAFYPRTREIQRNVLIHQSQAVNQRLRDLDQDIKRAFGLEIQHRLALLMAKRGDEHIKGDER